MRFHTPDFVVFWFAVLALHCLVRGNETRKTLLLAASLLFAGWVDPKSLFVLFTSALVTYQVGRRIAAEEEVNRRKAWLAVAVAANLGLLGWFKYQGFFVESVAAVLRSVDVFASLRPLEVALPVGISFYTLQAIGYAVDVYRRPLRATSSLRDFALFLTFFPRFTSGPILRSAAFLPQLARSVTIHLEPAVLFLFLGGLVKKTLIADNLSPFVDGVYADLGRWPSPVIALATVACTIQIYCDFSGYTDMAIALGRVLGYRLPQNFDFPFLARNPSDFWRRWHVSFSSWIRDYIFVSLPGGERSAILRWRNLLITMFAAGLWHGPAWTFAFWGLAHGFLLVCHDAYGLVRRRLNRAYRPSNTAVARWLSIAAMQYCVVVTTAFFRAPDVSSALSAIRSIVFLDLGSPLLNINLTEIQASRAALLMAGFLLLHLRAWHAGRLEESLGRLPIRFALPVCLAIGFFAYCLWPTDEPPFIYQRF